MIIAWNEFMPWHALFGGTLIGLSASILLIFNGQIAGISGIVSRLLAHITPSKSTQPVAPWRLLFIAGLLASPLLMPLIINTDNLQLSLPTNPEGSVTIIVLAIVGGFLIGYGARLANGCTSGHGVCGLARLSKRSFVAVMTFMATSIVTVYILRHLLGWI